MDYVELDMEIDPVDPFRDVVAHYLAEKGFDSFLETETGLKAYCPAKEFDQKEVNLIQNDWEAVKHYRTTQIKKENWNAKWESDFQPVIIDDQLLIKASFHDLQEDNFDFVIEIEPKMSFGTGHHATTSLISQQLLKMDIQDQKVLDMGCGTGVLAILAEKLGAKEIHAVDIDQWAIDNTLENLQRNACRFITKVEKGNKEQILGQHYDGILANINRNVLLDHMSTYSNCLEEGGWLMISGFYRSDEQQLIGLAESLSLKHIDGNHQRDWSTLLFKKMA